MLIKSLSKNITKLKLENIMPCLVIVLLFSPFEKIQFLAVFLAALLFVISKRKMRFINFKDSLKRNFLIRVVVALFGFQLINYLFAMLQGRADLLTLPLFLFSFWLPMSVVFLVNANNYKTTRKFLLLIILLEVALVILMQMKKGNIFPHDFARGTTSSTHLFAFCIVWLLFEYICRKKINIFTILVIFCAGLALFLSDSKSVITVAITVLSIVFFIGVLKKYPLKFYFKCALYFVFLTLILFLNLTIDKIYPKKERGKSSAISQTENSFKNRLMSSPRYLTEKYGFKRLIDIYINGEMNHKFVFIKRGFEHIAANNLLFIGTSSGTLGSRASNVRAYETLFKPIDTKLGILGTYSSPATQVVYKGLYTKEYHEKAKIYIKILALPFSSLFSFILENGIIGFIIFLLSVTYLLQLCLNFSQPVVLESVFLVLLVFCYGIFDTIWERPFLMGIFYLILAINFRSLQHESSSSDKYVPQ